MSEDALAEHYSHGSLEKQILDALAAVGADPEHLESEQLAAVDEFHRGCGCSMWAADWAERPVSWPATTTWTWSESS